ncbi:MAG TPA: chorismate mutase [Candidatus Atribacteria bacterium]|jgi:chorismate mutase|uniref:chorismate mutase n=1 Tax=Candidatus Sordicultor fermentans TaxID=1953203 RepID=UPI001692463E|nr:chorismate mutase [Atribacterota bacterium]NLY04742.1 chorismate mutase [Candidatus Atribacteria bacterium]MDI9607932.1 chorismate mutase [Atribacterota bacterium]MDY0134290.1 chorismate mutase [Atribacterota bacterium]HOA98413.1 chorismate mutase [Candidatus Atribacteria bacterium]
MEKKVRGIRGATVVEKDDKEEIKKAAKELFDLLLRENNISPSEIVAVFITATPDLHSTFPAEAIRERDEFRYIPFICAQEMRVEGALEKCIRFLVLAYTDKDQIDIHHLYLGKASSLREDLSRRENL